MICVVLIIKHFTESLFMFPCLWMKAFVTKESTLRETPKRDKHFIWCNFDYLFFSVRDGSFCYAIRVCNTNDGSMWKILVYCALFVECEVDWPIKYRTIGIAVSNLPSSELHSWPQVQIISLFTLDPRSKLYLYSAISSFHPPADQIGCCLTRFAWLNTQFLFCQIHVIVRQMWKNCSHISFYWTLKREKLLT